MLECMPSRNVRRLDIQDVYYHVYTRGINKQQVFIDSEDKTYFLYLISRYLSKLPAKNSKGYTYPHYRDMLELLVFCLMDNHVHLLIYQRQEKTLSKFMQSLITAYTAYFNKKYQRCGSLFDHKFRASIILSDTYLIHTSRYIHLNPRSWKRFAYSSFRYILDGEEPEWLQPQRILFYFATTREYVRFHEDYVGHKKMLNTLKHELAG